MDEDVLWFNISVHNVFLCKNFEGVGKLSKIDQALLFSKRTVFFQNFFKCAPVAVFINEIEIVNCLEHIEISDDVGTVLQLCQGVDFIDGTFLKFGHLLKLIGLHHFDGHLLLGDHVDSFVDFGVNSLSQFHLQ